MMVLESGDLKERARWIAHYSKVAGEAVAAGRHKEAAKYYAEAAELSKRAGDFWSIDYFSNRAREAKQRAMKSFLDKNVRGFHIFLLFLATTFFASPRISGSVTGVSFSAFNYLGIVFFVALLIAVNLKVYARKGW